MVIKTNGSDKTEIKKIPPLAIAASKLSLEHNFPMADSIILSAVREFDATLWTQDSDFKNIKGVKYFPKK